MEGNKSIICDSCLLDLKQCCASLPREFDRIELKSDFTLCVRYDGLLVPYNCFFFFAIQDQNIFLVLTELGIC